MVTHYDHGSKDPTPIEDVMGQAYQIIGQILNMAEEAKPIPNDWQVKVLSYFAANKYNPNFDWSLGGNNAKSD